MKIRLPLCVSGRKGSNIEQTPERSGCNSLLHHPLRPWISGMQGAISRFDSQRPEAF
jgi:hypothetical protein